MTMRQSTGRASRVAVALLAVAAFAVAGAGAASAAPGGYGPIGEDPATAIGLSSDVLVAGTVRPGGGTVAAPTPQGLVALHVPIGVFAVPVQISIAGLTEQAGAAILPRDASGGFIAGFGISARLVGGAAGSPAALSPGQVMTFSVTKDARIRLGDKIYLVGSTGDVRVITVSHGGAMTVQLSGPTSVLVLRPGSATPGSTTGAEPAVPQGNLPATGAGIDVVSVSLLASLLVGTGVVLLAAARGRRASRGAR
ncbi:MAG TPA: hypothetical protein VIC82_05130 [Candidatus Nanopelagicales bacterium]|jgi:hypothetical protein